MFEWLTGFKKILVSGPQRSGTRICARMIAYDTGHDYIDEEDLQIDSLIWLASFLSNKRDLVIQCPALCRYIHNFSTDKTAIILMRRDIADIRDSQKRIGWSWEGLELARYDNPNGSIAEVKYQFWEQNQKKHIKNAFEIAYESLEVHPLWVPKSQRQKFKPTQTTSHLDKPILHQNVRPSPKPGILYLEKDAVDPAVLVKTGQPPKLLNETGQFVWSLCDGSHTRQDILQALQDRFSDIEEDVLARDLDEFIKNMVDNTFLQLHSDSVDNNRRPLKNEPEVKQR